MAAATSTRERLVTEAMRLFSEKGYGATSVSQIEAAAGLAAGSGALYHHFKSKEALLDAGIDRQLDRRRAMRDIRALFAGLGDLRSRTHRPRSLPAQRRRRGDRAAPDRRTNAGRPVGPARHRLRRARRGLNAELADWIAAWAPTLRERTATSSPRSGVNACWVHGSRPACSTSPRRESRTTDTWPSGPRWWPPASKRSPEDGPTRAVLLCRTVTYWHPESLRGHVVIVTGAARGIGKGVSAALLERGASVLLVDVDRDRLASTTSEFTDSGLPAEQLVVDLRDPDAAPEIVATALDRLGGAPTGW